LYAVHCLPLSLPPARLEQSPSLPLIATFFSLPLNLVHYRLLLGIWGTLLFFWGTLFVDLFFSPSGTTTYYFLLFYLLLQLFAYTFTRGRVLILPLSFYTFTHSPFTIHDVSFPALCTMPYLCAPALLSSSHPFFIFLSFLSLTSLDKHFFLDVDYRRV
jgi:hypothetical protein